MEYVTRGAKSNRNKDNRAKGKQNKQTRNFYNDSCVEYKIHFLKKAYVDNA